jgi:hypothetical protein
MKDGDWVRSHLQGIWQIERVVPPHYEPRCTLDVPKVLYDGPAIILKRIVNDKWVKSFTTDAVHASLIRPVGSTERTILKRFLGENPAIVQAFEAFEKPVDSMLNLGFWLPSRRALRTFAVDFKRVFDRAIQRGMTSDAILAEITGTKYSRALGKMPNTATLQFVCRDHEVSRKELVYREMSVLDF